MVLPASAKCIAVFVFFVYCLFYLFIYLFICFFLLFFFNWSTEMAVLT